MKNKSAFIVTCFVLQMLSIPALAQSYTMKKGFAQFHANATLNTYDGTSEQLEGSIDLNFKKIYFKLPVKSLNTGSGLRNKDMYKLLETDKYPFIEFQGEILSGFNNSSNDNQTVIVRGNFNMHGVKKVITVNGQLRKSGNLLELKSEWDINVSEYNIKPPKLLFNEVVDKHHLLISGQLRASEESLIKE